MKVISMTSSIYICYVFLTMMSEFEQYLSFYQLHNNQLSFIMASKEDAVDPTSQSTADIVNKVPAIDFELFQDVQSGDHCDGNKHRKCMAMNRIIAALDYYQHLVLGAMADKFVDDPRAAFTAFCEEVYPKRVMLNDYIHWVLHHKDTESIQAIRAQLHFICESAKICGATTRHYRDRRHDDTTEQTPLNWFTEKMDIVHFNVYHLTELGLRVTAECDIEEDEQESELVDFTLKRMGKVIEAKRAMVCSTVT